MPGVSIIIPTLNEADNIDPLLKRILAVKLQSGVELEIIIVDDSSTDDTRDRVRAWSDSHPVRLVCRNSKDGLASAVVAGAREADHDIVLVMDADLSHPPESIPQMLQPLLDNSCDMVIGSRYVEGGATPEWPLARKVASKMATMPARLFTDVNDPLAGFFATGKQRLSTLRHDVPGFKIGLEVLAVGGDSLRVCEVPIVFHDRFEGFSKMNKQVILDYLKQVVQLSRLPRDVCSPFRFAVLIGVGAVLDYLFFTAAQQRGFSPLAAHMAALPAAGLLMFILALLQRRPHPSRPLTWGRLCGALFGLPLAISLQAGVWQLCRQLPWLGEPITFIIAALAGIAGYLCFLAVFVLSGYRELGGWTRLRIGAIGIVLFSLVIRLVYLGLPELMEQEAYYWNYAQHLDIGYLDHPPLVALLVWLGTAVFGTTEFGVRIGAYLCWFVTAFFCYRLSCRIFGRTAALGAVALVALLPLYFGIGLVMTPDAPLLAAWSALLYFLYRALVEDQRGGWAGVAVSLGLGMLSKYTIVLLAPAVILFMLIDSRARRWFLRPEPYGAALAALLLFAPVIVWNYQHEWVSFLFQGEQRITGRSHFTSHLLVGYIALILTPAGVLAALFFLLRGNRFFMAAGEICRQQNGRLLNRSFLFLWLMTVLPLLVFAIFSITREVKLNWTIPLWLAALPFIACTAMAVGAEFRSRLPAFVHWLWKPTACLLLLALASLLHYATLGLPGLPAADGPFLTGWSGFARDIEAAVNRAEEQSGNRPVVVGMDKYQIASGLAFYRAKNSADPAGRRRAVDETLGWHLFGWNSLMYRYWSDPEDFRGRDIMAVASSEIRVEYPYYQKRVIRMNPIRSMEISKNGQPVSRFFSRLIFDYQPEEK